MNLKNNNAFFWRALSAVLALVLILICAYEISQENSMKEAEKTAKKTAEATAEKKEKTIDGDQALTLWTDQAPLKKELVSYVEDVTKEGSANFIPIQDRIAVFDLNGTLFCETDPIYFDWSMYVYRVLEDPQYKDKASKDQIEIANQIKEAIKTGTIPKDFEEEQAKANAQVYKNMTPEEFAKYINEFKNQPAAGYQGMTKGQAFYKPMVEVFNYLTANDFTCYICSGTDRFEIRTIAEGNLDIPANRIIGSDNSLVADHQGEKDHLDYVYDKDDKLVFSGELTANNIRMNKVTAMMKEIGTQPVLSFGNSSGDYSMAEFVTSNNPYQSKAFMVCCDDLERENGNQEKADTMAATCKEKGWTPISMKNDWTTIYGDGVSKK